MFLSPTVRILLAHICSMLGFSGFAVNLVTLKSLWGLSSGEAGLIASGFFLGYISTVTLWNALTDHRPTLGIYLMGSALTALGSLSFGLLAQGLWTALFAQMLLGVGVAATYMPGLRMLNEIRPDARAIAFYTAFFGIGTAGSLWISGSLSQAWGWQTAFLVLALGPVISGLLVRFAARDAQVPPTRSAHRPGLLQLMLPWQAWRHALEQPMVARYTLGYLVHCLELFGTRAWAVAFLTAALVASPAPLTPASMAAVVALASTPASILGNELAGRFGRIGWVTGVMVMTSLVGLCLTLVIGLPWGWVLLLMLLHSLLLMADSATLTAGLVASAPASVKGAALGLYSLLGFTGAALGPLVFGLALDWAGGMNSPHGWLAGFAVLGLGTLIFPLGVWGSALRTSARPAQAN